ncbi:hypothetical protein HDE78_002104 [Rhodanobacter sp. K2T2]|nr:hypothetical protein [Rhodanobacter sp. K2T2]
MHQPLEPGKIEKIGRASAQVQLYQWAIPVEAGREPFDFPQQGAQIAIGHGGISTDYMHAAAVEAGAETERHVHVQRQRPRNGIFVGGAYRLDERGVAEIFAKMGRRRVARVPRGGGVVKRQQRGIERRF